MMAWLKLGCLLVYALGLAAWSGLWPGGSAFAVAAAVLLGAHALEALMTFRYLRHYRGSLAASVVLALLFGLLHVLPLVRQARRT